MRPEYAESGRSPYKLHENDDYDVQYYVSSTLAYSAYFKCL